MNVEPILTLMPLPPELPGKAGRPDGAKPAQTKPKMVKWIALTAGLLALIGLIIGAAVFLKQKNAPAPEEEIDASDAAIFAQGECGENLTWILYESGQLTLSGSGEMEDFDLDDHSSPWMEDSDLDNHLSPWFEMTGAITDVRLPKGLTSIGENAFRDCENLTIHAPKGSYAETYAQENGIPFEAAG